MWHNAGVMIPVVGSRDRQVCLWNIRLEGSRKRHALGVMVGFGLVCCFVLLFVFISFLYFYIFRFHIFTFYILHYIFICSIFLFLSVSFFISLFFIFIFTFFYFLFIYSSIHPSIDPPVLTPTGPRTPTRHQRHRPLAPPALPNTPPADHRLTTHHTPLQRPHNLGTYPTTPSIAHLTCTGVLHSE